MVSLQLKLLISLPILAITILFTEFNVSASDDELAYVKEELEFFKQPLESSEVLPRLEAGSILVVRSNPRREENGFLRVKQVQAEKGDVRPWGWIKIDKATEHLDMINKLIARETTTAFIHWRIDDTTGRWEYVYEKIEIPTGTELNAQPLLPRYKNGVLKIHFNSAAHEISEDPTHPLYGAIKGHLWLRNFEFVTSPYTPQE